MKNAAEAILKRPIASAWMIGFVSYCAIRVIKAAKGIKHDPEVVIKVEE